MKKTIIFIHGMFQNARSWQYWVAYFTPLGYDCVAESWPLHEGEPEELRNYIPAGLGDLRLEEVVSKFAALVTAKDNNAILIGHSVGGLVVQSLISKGHGSMGICISSVAPNRMLAFDWGFFRNSISIANPFKGDEPFLMTPKGFHQNFCNTMTEAESDEAYARTATHDSRNMLRDCMMADGEIELEKTNKPLLFIGAEQDEIIPPELNEKNAAAYPEGIAEFVMYPGKGHFICGQAGWEQIADQIEKWVQEKIQTVSGVTDMGI
jgi:pimeloyl-ACP methyl ester carboxylesterase